MQALNPKHFPPVSNVSPMHSPFPQATCHHSRSATIIFSISRANASFRGAVTPRHPGEKSREQADRNSKWSSDSDSGAEIRAALSLRRARESD